MSKNWCGPLVGLAVLLLGGPAEGDEASPATPAKAETAQQEEHLSGVAGLGATAITGSTAVFTLSGDVLVEYQSKKWVASVEGEGAYGLARQRGVPNEIVAQDIDLELRGERRFNPHWGVFLIAEGSANHPQDRELRLEGEAGAAYTALEEVQENGDQRVLLRFDLGLRAAEDYRFEYEPIQVNLENVGMFGPSLGATLRYEFSERTFFSQYVRGNVNVTGDARLIVESRTKVAFTVTGQLMFQLSYLLQVDTSPAPGVAQVDSALTMGLDYMF